MKIVYIDEEASTLRFQSKFEVLQDEGIEVIPITKVAEVLPTLKNHADTISLIILDIIMPPAPTYTVEETRGGTRTGVFVLKSIRALLPAVPVVVVSVMPSEELSKEMTGLNVTEFLSKPITGTELAEQIRTVLGRAR